MNQSLLDTFEKKLTKQLAELEQQLGGQFDEERELQPPQVGDQIDHALDSRAEVLDRVSESEVKLVAKIKLALQRIKDGTYDQCGSCGEVIPLARLEAKPSVSLCLDCQIKHESQQTKRP
ncbi:TraR/DksA family transcriptional regulator [Roseibacillus persicicus]|uniref:TraR/DksA family transcriptional regulator n=1 Tax=Roseibacillus persicicus TaxID=454148 RepID=UPI00398B781B